MLAQVILILAQTAPIWVTFILLMLFWHIWLIYIRSEYFFKVETVLLQIKLPKEMMKSPLAMELFLTSLHQTSGEGTWYDKYWLGKTRTWYSLEMVSIEGDVRFYIWTRKLLQKFTESSLYAQFPGIEVHPAEDYARPVDYDPATMGMFATEMEFLKDDAYPIKTYVDFGLDKDPKEEFKVDPIAPVLEYLGSIGANQQAWIQIIVRAYRPDKRKPGSFFKFKHDTLKDNAQKIINEILIRDPKTKVSGSPEEGFSKNPTITKGEQEVIAAIERNMNKIQFDVGIRCLYWGKKGFFDPACISGILGSWKQYNTGSLNGIKPYTDEYSMSYSYPWQDFMGLKLKKDLRRFLDGYKRRNFFFPPVKGYNVLVMSTEELATIFHFPGQVAAAPSFTRILSKKSEAPSNLPL
ncbi:MAG: hypothetical protein KBD47_00105 [Candidatus Pacebacteria bacterium]|jgi:hypothetical protein|nr:hypothetical protein [Candidatus Paceibacterota bacterium]